MLSADKIGPAIRSLRESKGYSQEFMAEQLRVAQSTYACLESGKFILRIDRLIQILNVLGTTLPELLDMDPEAFASHHANGGPGINPDVKEVYEKLICEMKEEIAFLKDLVRSSTELRR